MADFRALCTELADALDHNRQCLMDDRSLTHPLADRARMLLAVDEAETTVPTLAEDALIALERIERGDATHGGDDFLLIATALGQLRRHATPRPVPVDLFKLPVAEDCDAEGRCWFFFLLSGDPTWTLEHYTAARCSGRSHWLPAHAIPLPQENADVQ